MMPDLAHFLTGNQLALSAVLLVLALIGMRSESTRISRVLPGPAVVLLLGFALGNSDLLPRAHVVYDAIWAHLVPVAIVLLVLRVNLRRVMRDMGSMTGAFFIGCMGTIIGALLWFRLLPLGDYGTQLAGVYGATYIGGSMNYVAVARAVGFSDPGLFAAGVAADNVVGTLYLILLGFLARSGWFGRSAWNEDKIADSDPEAVQRWPHVNEIARSLVVASLIVILCQQLTRAIGYEQWLVLAVTAAALIVAAVLPRAAGNLGGTYESGMLLMYLFFGTIGAGADIGPLIHRAPVMAAYAGLICLTHLLVLLVIGKLLRLDVGEMFTASIACILGPAPTAALAAGQGWNRLVAPGIMAALLGYAIANFIGVGTSAAAARIVSAPVVDVQTEGRTP